MSSAPSIILASASPRRQDLLSQAGVSFTIVVPGCDETPLAGESAREMVERLARMKASTVAQYHPDAFVLGADTTVCVDGRSLGKPLSREEAWEMLAAIQDRTHEVWGGVALVHASSGLSATWSDVTSVRMRPMDSDTIRSYVETGEPMDKAGAYAIQGIGLQYVDSINGSYSNVVGLNIARVMEMFREYVWR